VPATFFSPLLIGDDPPDDDRPDDPPDDDRPEAAQ
jgi:hypothetical protein